MMNTYHQGVTNGITTAEHERLTFLVKTASRWDGAISERLWVHEAVIDGHIVRELLQLLRIISQIADLLSKKLRNIRTQRTISGNIYCHKKHEHTSCKSTSPAVDGLMIFDNFGGQCMIMFLYTSEYLKRMKTGNDASIATTIGAAKLGASTACIDFPKQNVQMMSMLRHRKA